MGADVQRFDIARKLRRLAMDDWHKPNGIDPYRKLLHIFGLKKTAGRGRADFFDCAEDDFRALVVAIADAIDPVATMECTADSFDEEWGRVSDWRCDRCGWTDMQRQGRPDYCPHCGARIVDSNLVRDFLAYATVPVASKAPAPALERMSRPEGVSEAPAAADRLCHACRDELAKPPYERSAGE